jgi:membrane-associated protein
LHQLIDFLHSLTDPDKLIHLLSTVMTGWVGYAVLFLIVFAESGLLVGFFLPGDSLLFTVGVVAGAGKLPIGVMIAMLAFASMLGDGIGFLLGSTLGYRLFSNPKSKIFRREYLDRTHEFYERHGGKTIIYAKFVPIIRTFAAFIAGVGKMHYSRFLSFNIFGAIGWVALMISAGYGLGNVPIIRHNFEKVVLIIIAVSLVPAVLQILKSRKARPVESEVDATATDYYLARDVIGKRRAEKEHCICRILRNTEPAERNFRQHLLTSGALHPDMHLLPAHRNRCVGIIQGLDQTRLN